MNCNNISLQGINNLFFATVETDEIDYNIIDAVGTIYLNDALDFEKIYFNSSNFKQKRTSDQKGIYYDKSFELSVGDIMNESIAAYEGKKLVIIFQDANGNWYITGHEKPFSLDKYEGETEKGLLEYTLSQSSYRKIESLDLNSVPDLPIIPLFSYTSNNTLFDSISTGATFTYWIKLSSIPSGEQIIFEKQNKYKITFTHVSGNSYTFKNYYNRTGSIVADNTEDTLTLNLGAWYFIVSRVDGTGSFTTNYQLQFNSSGTEVYNEPGIFAWTGSSRTFASSNKPLQLYRSSNYELKYIGIYSRSLPLPTFGTEIATLLNTGNGLAYSFLDDYPTIDLEHRLIAYYDTIDFSSDTISDQHTNNLNLTYNG